MFIENWIQFLSLKPKDFGKIIIYFNVFSNSNPKPNPNTSAYPQPKPQIKCVAVGSFICHVSSAMRQRNDLNIADKYR